MPRILPAGHEVQDSPADYTKPGLFSHGSGSGFRHGLSLTDAERSAVVSGLYSTRIGDCTVRFQAVQVRP